MDPVQARLQHTALKLAARVAPRRTRERMEQLRTPRTVEVPGGVDHSTRRKADRFHEHTND
jgi:hypothetical protein